MKQENQVRISERALLARVNRKLAVNDEIMRKTHEDSRCFYDLGYYYVIDARSNAILCKDVGLEAEARELGVLKAGEEVAG